jgi:hypothetical protein
VLHATTPIADAVVVDFLVMIRRRRVPIVTIRSKRRSRRRAQGVLQEAVVGGVSITETQTRIPIEPQMCRKKGDPVTVSSISRRPQETTPVGPPAGNAVSVTVARMGPSKDSTREHHPWSHTHAPTTADLCSAHARLYIRRRCAEGRMRLRRL